MTLDLLISQLEKYGNETRARVTFSTGVLLSGRVRRFIEMYVESGASLHAKESKGPLESDWLVSGNVKELKFLLKWASNL